MMVHLERRKEDGRLNRRLDERKCVFSVRTANLFQACLFSM